MVTLNQSITTDVFIRGGWFTNSTTVVIPGCTVNSVNIIDDDTISVNITTPAVDGFHDVEVTNEGGTTVFTNGIEVKLSVWSDLRAGGDVFNVGTDIRLRAGMTMNRDATGMFFTGNDPWSSWVKFESLGWTRGQNLTMQMIFTRPTSFMMIGIGSTATNETNTAQYAQAENEAYFNSATSFWGLYGNNGTIGSAGNQNNTTTIAGGTGVYKIKFEGDGGVGSAFTLYELPSVNQGDWDDESNIITSMTVGGTLNPDEVNIMPFIIPRADTQRFLAIKVE